MPRRTPRGPRGRPMPPAPHWLRPRAQPYVSDPGPILTRLAPSRPRSQGANPVARVVVDVMLKPEILDPQGKAVHGALPRLGFTGVSDVRQGKRFELEVEGE